MTVFRLVASTLMIFLGVCLPTQDTGAQIIRDCDVCPEMVIVPAGEFVMGEPRPDDPKFGWGGPEVAVTIERPFAMGRYEVKRAQYRVFLDDTGYNMDMPCTTVWQDLTGTDAKPSWEEPLYPGGFRPEPDHPIVCVGWPDVQAYVTWLNTKVDGARLYYLPSEAEWEYAARAGTSGRRPFEGDETASCDHANVGDVTYAQIIGRESVACTDGYAFTSPVGTFPPNLFGLYDMVGNVWEWTHDCWHPDHSRATGTGAPLVRGGDCTKRVMRGAGFTSEAFYLTVATRGADPVPHTRLVLLGFRVAATVP